MEISFKKLFLYLVRLWWLFVAVAIVGGVVGLIVADAKEETFRYDCQVRVKLESSESLGENFLDVTNYVIVNVVETVKNPDFLENQFKAAGASKLIGKDTGKDVGDYVKITRLSSSDFLNITCTTNSAATSEQIIKKILDNVGGEIDRVLGGEQVSLVKTGEPRLVEEAVNRKVTSSLVGAVIGLVLLAVVLVCVRLFDTRIYDEAEITERYEANFLGSLRGGKRA